MNQAEKYYKEKIDKLTSEINKLSININKIGWLRLVIVVIGIAISAICYKNYTVKSAIFSGVIAVLIFAVVVIIHANKMELKEKLEAVLEFNEKGMKRLNGEYKTFQDIGEEFIEENHPFAQDIDIIGKNSLFQMINTTRTKSGRNKLAEILLLRKLPSKSEIESKQEAIKELGSKVEWREKLYVSATFREENKEELEGLLEWCKAKGKNSLNRVIVASVFIAITLISIFLSIIGTIPVSFLILNLIVNFGVIKVLTNDMGEVITLFESIKNSIRGYANILELIEDEKFESDYLKELQSKLNNNKNKSCKNEMKKLSSLLDWVGDSTGNAYFFILNVLAFADVFIIYNLNKWRIENGNEIENWLKVMGEFDALASVSNLSFDHEDWCYATITQNEISAIDVAHPLIGERAVSNSFEMKEPTQATLITGSNMSGKSTFLRTIGTNLLLAYIGAPCRAKNFKCDIMNIYTCMRTKDNLEESISSFYAEILRIKLIIEACKRGEKVFFLLDEIFKGTNSKDRHTGATVLVKQLVQNGAIGLLSTHDLELCDLEETMKEVENYNFREYYEDDKIKFDYKLRKGRSTTQNAVYLMKLAGIEI